MAKKTIEAIVRMNDQTFTAAQSVVRNVRQVTEEYGKLDKAMRKAQWKAVDDRRANDNTLARQRISNLEREVQLGHRGATVALEQARATATFRKERESLLRITRMETSTMRQRIDAYKEVFQLERLHAAQMKQLAAGGPRGGSGIGAAAGGLMSRFGSLAAGYAGFNLVSTIYQRQEESMQARIDFEKSMTEFLAVGDNSRNINANRLKVLSTSNASGRSAAEIADLFAFIDQGMPTQSEKEKDELRKVVLRMGQLSNARLSSWAEALIKGMNQFGHEVSGPRELADKFQKTIDLGFVTPEEFAQHSIRPIIAGGSQGFKLDEILGVYAAATNAAKDAQVASTALSNIFLQMNQGAKEGVHLTGSLLDRLQQLAQVDPDLRTKIFDVRNATVLSGTIKLLEQAKVFTEGIGNAAGDTDKKLSAMANNFTRSMTSIADGLKNLQENMKLGFQGDTDFAAHMALREASRAYVRSSDIGENLPTFVINTYAELDRILHNSRGGARVLITQATERMKAGDIEGARQSFELAKSTGTVPKEFADQWDKDFADHFAKKQQENSTDALAKRMSEGIGTSAAAVAHVKLAQYLNDRAVRGYYDARDHDSIQDILGKIKADPAKAEKLDGFLKDAADNERSITRHLEITRAPDKLKEMMGSKTGREIIERVQKFDIAGKRDMILGSHPSFLEKLMGAKSTPGTLAGVIGAAAKNLLTEVLGPTNVAFLRLGRGDRADLSRDFEHLRPQSGMWSEGSGIFQDLAGQRRVQDDMRRVWSEIEKNTKTTAEAVEIMKKIWGSIGTLKVSGV